jgi:hypothetical protein
MAAAIIAKKSTLWPRAKKSPTLGTRDNNKNERRQNKTNKNKTNKNKTNENINEC